MLTNHIIETIRNEIINAFPDGLKTTADMALEMMSHSKNEVARDAAEYIKVSKKLVDVKTFFAFFMSLVSNNPVKIQERAFDNGLAGLLEVKNHLAKKYVQNHMERQQTIAYSIFSWTVLMSNAKPDFKKQGLIY